MARRAFRRHLRQGQAGPIPAGWTAASNLPSWVAERISEQLSPADAHAIAQAMVCAGLAMRWRGPGNTRWLICSHQLPDPLESLLVAAEPDA